MGTEDLVAGTIQSRIRRRWPFGRDHPRTGTELALDLLARALRHREIMRTANVADAARNNAAWCEAVCRAHGSPGELRATHWLNRRAAPPFYPNLVTFTATADPILAAIERLARRPPAASWAVKDSFASLALEPHGYQVLFEAEWIVLPSSASDGSSTVGTRWLRIRSDTGLAAWENAWGEGGEETRIFLPSLLKWDDIAVIAVIDKSDVIQAGLIANRTGSVVGVSNLFAHGDDAARLRASCIAAARRTFPGLPLVGYESGPMLAELHTLGFLSLGPLRVWTNAA